MSFSRESRTKSSHLRRLREISLLYNCTIAKLSIFSRIIQSHCYSARIKLFLAWLNGCGTCTINNNNIRRCRLLRYMSKEWNWMANSLRVEVEEEKINILAQCLMFSLMNIKSNSNSRTEAKVSSHFIMLTINKTAFGSIIHSTVSSMALILKHTDLIGSIYILFD